MRLAKAYPEWKPEGDALVRELHFRDFQEALAFVEHVAEGAIDHRRRPRVSISQNRVRLGVANVHRAGFALAEMRLLARVEDVIAGWHAPRR